MVQTRAYGPHDKRQETASTLVYSVEDIRRAVTIAVDAERPCSLRLGADVLASNTITAPSSLVSFELSGAGRYRLLASGEIGTLLNLGANPAVIEDLTIECLDGGSIEKAIELSSNVVAQTVLRNV